MHSKTYGLILSKIIIPTKPKMIRFNNNPGINNALIKIDKPKNKKGSFKIPEVQNNKLGKSKRIKKKGNDFKEVYGLNAIKRFLSPIKEIKHMKSECITGFPKDIK